MALRRYGVVVVVLLTMMTGCVQDEPSVLRAEDVLSEPDAAAMRHVRQACDTEAGIWNFYDPTDGTFESVHAALDGTDILLPEGTTIVTEESPERTSVEFLDEGQFQGLVVLLHDEDGWAFHIVAICGPS